MARALIEQEDFGGGMFRGRRAPIDSVYDAVNCLINDERELFRRGGAAFLSDAAGSTLEGLAAADTFAGARVLATNNGTTLFAMPTFESGGGTTLLQVGTSLILTDETRSRPVRVGPYTIYGQYRIVGLDTVYDMLALYGGSVRTAGYSTGTATVTAGSKTVTGVGTSWTANVGKGSLITFTGSSLVGVVESVASNTSLTLSDAWAGSTLSGVTYSVGSVKTFTLTAGTIAANAPVFLGAIGSPARLLLAFNDIVRFSPRGSLVLDPAEYHQLPGGTAVRGITAFQDTAVVFAQNGVWAIQNMAFDPLDAAGNDQHRVSQINKDLVLWGHEGISAYEGALLVPAMDDVYLFTLDGPPVPLSGSVRPMYRSYVEAGYKPGAAAVYRGHYVLPITASNGSTVLDVLVCRLDLRGADGARRPAWTRWANQAAGGAYARAIDQTTGTTTLLGINGQRITALTQCFSPSATYKQDADGTAHQADVWTRDFATGPGRQNMVSKFRAEYELVDAASDNPTLAVFWATGPEGSLPTNRVAQRGGVESFGLDFSRWPVGMRADRIRFRIMSSGAATRFILRKVGVEISRSGRR